MQHTEESICKLFRITPEQLKVNTHDEQWELYRKQMESAVFMNLGISSKYLVNSNG